MTVLTISTRPVPLEQPLRLPARARDHEAHPTAPRDVDRDADRPDSVFGTGDEMNVTVRMVIPLRREFGRMLDVSHFMHDDVYARGMIDLAKSSSDARLRGYATFLELHKGLVPAEPPAGKLSSSGASAVAAKPQAAASRAADFAGVKQRSANLVLALLGPTAQALCLRLEAAATVDEFVAAAKRAHAVVRDIRGEARARGFADQVERLIGQLPTRPG